MRTQWHVRLRVGRGVAVSIRVDTEEAEVPRMAGIAPVVGIGTELIHCAGRCNDEADARIDPLDEEQALIPSVEGLESPAALAGSARYSGNGLGC